MVVGLSVKSGIDSSDVDDGVGITVTVTGTEVVTTIRVVPGASDDDVSCGTSSAFSAAGMGPGAG